MGSAVNRQLDRDVLLLGFSGLVVIAAWRMVTGCPTCTKVGERAAVAKPGSAVTATQVIMDLGTVLLVVVVGSAVGFLTGLFGVGGGFVIVPALALVLKLLGC